MKEKLGRNFIQFISGVVLVKQLIENSEKERDSLLSQIKKLRAESDSFRKTFKNSKSHIVLIALDSDLTEVDTNKKIVTKLQNELQIAQGEILSLKKTITQFSSQDIDQ